MSLTAKKMMIVAAAAGAAAAAVGAAVCALFLTEPALPFAAGVLLGTALTLLKIFMLDRAVETVTGPGVKNAAGYAFIQNIIRYVLTGGVLFLAVKVSFLNVWGAAAGILTFPAAAYSMKFILKADGAATARPGEGQG